MPIKQIRIPLHASWFPNLIAKSASQVAFSENGSRIPFIKHAFILVLCLSGAVGCKFFDPNENCLNPRSTCFTPQTVAPYVVNYVPVPNNGSTSVSKLKGIQITFSQRLKDWLTPERYQLSNLGNLKIASVEQTGTYTVTLHLSGKLSNGNVDVSFPTLTNFTGLPFAKGTSVRLIGNLDIGVNISDSQSAYFVSSAGGTGKSSATINWSHDYRIDPNNNNSYVLKLGGSTCADASAISGGTNTSGNFLPGNTQVTSTIPVAGNFSSGGTYFVRICVENKSGYNKSGEAVALIISDNYLPIVQASIGTGAYARQQSVTFSCTDNCKAIAYNVAQGHSAQSAPTAPSFDGDGNLLSGTLLTGSWTTPYAGDSTHSTISVVAVDHAGNQSAPLVISYQINSLLPVISLNSPPATRSYISGNSGINSTTVNWQANQSGNYLVCLGGNGCAAGPSCGAGTPIGSVQPYTSGSSVASDITTTGPPALSAGQNTVHICLSNGVQVADSSLIVNRSDTALTVSSVIPGDISNAIPGAAPVAITLTAPIPIDLSTVTTNTADTSCSGSLQISAAGDNFATCVQMTTQPVALSSQAFLLNAAGGFNPGIYKVRITTDLKDVAGNSLAGTYTQNTGFAVSGLVRQFTFNSDSTGLQDRALTGLHLSATGNPKKVNGVDGEPQGAYRFDGAANEYLSGFDTGLPPGQAPRTICAWINAGAQCGTTCAALMYGNSHGAYLGNRGNTAGYGIAAVSDSLGGTPLKLNTWTHFCHVYDGTNVRVFFNGVQDGTNPAAAATTLGNGLFVGKPSAGGLSGFNGRIDDVRVYAGALKPDAIRQVAVQVPVGLQAYYSFSDAASQTATDYSSNGHNGTLAGNPSAANDRFGNTGAYSFTATNQWIAASDTGFPAGQDGRTICAWVNPTALPTAGNYATALRYGNTAMSEAQAIGFYYNGTTHTVFFGAWGDDVTASQNISLNTWMHICGSYDGKTANLYANGVKIESASKNWNTVLAGTSGLFIGQGDNSGTSLFRGAIDDVRIYNRVLEQHEITVLSSQLGTGLLRQYTFDFGRLTDDNGGAALNAIGNPTLGSGANGATNGAFVLNGSSQYFFNADTGLPFGSAARTMCVRLNPVNQGVNAYALSYGATNPGENSFLFSGGLAGVTFGNLSTNLTSTANLPANKWSHFCGVFDATGKATIFLNGATAIGPSAFNFNTISNGTFTIGARSDFTFRWAGGLDDVRIYSRALSPAEILELQGY